MKWIEIVGVIIGAFGIGTIITKILDIFWLQKMIEESEKRNWLRDRRLKAFSELSKELLSFGVHKGTFNDPFEAFANAAEAMLLIENKELVKRIEMFILELDELSTRQVDNEKKEVSAYHKLSRESREIFDALRTSLIK